MIGWWVAGALAQSPSIEVTDTGSVRGAILVAADADVVRQALTAATSRQAILAGDTRVTTREDGDCVLEDTFAPHAIKSVTYTVRTCPTSTGVRSALVESGDLARFQSTWEVHAADAGATVVYDLEVAPTFPLPAFIARASVKKGVGDALEAVRWHFDAAR